MKKSSESSDGDEWATDDDDLTLARMDLTLAQFSLAKCHAERVLRSNPSRPLADQTLADRILAVAHVHMAAASSAPEPKQRDWYAVLQLGDHNRNVFTPDSLFFAYRRLAGLLDPHVNGFAYASEALDLVSEAYLVLSDPERRSLYDTEIRTAKKSASPDFWTVCRTCFHVHQYGREHVGRELRCPTCQKLFVAEELPVKPPIVEGMDMYHCVWGCFPMGFPDGYRFQHAALQQEERAVPQPSRLARRARQTARKTVGVSKFVLTKKVCDDGDEDGDGGDG